MRYSYWSQSRFSKYIRSKFGLDNPEFLTAEGWDDHEIACKKKAPIVHWITNTGLDKLQNIVYYPYDKYKAFRNATIWKFIKNIWIFRKALWDYRAWDYTGLLTFMEVSARDMSRCHKENGHLMRSEDTAKELKVWADILQRVIEDDYFADKQEFVEGKGLFGGKFVQKKNTLPNRNAKSYYKLVEANKKNDLQLVAKMFARKVQTWWD